ncbi:SMI1/KNR4 family protein [Chitinophaga sp. 22321]|uniref:SMI1/KNR4 family protein n=1 Tax=Chitinophaga hostae TaxID=2831022 RepID=A0ABS5IUS1_9BACT|nr:SMI1/KNR4 family protein [Chitinophaga hostae]MBS0026707.1 SMI1/KNR4 family protein [Chitinophaga hostae]
MNSWTESVIQQWKNAGITLNKGALIEMITETENALGFRFPGEFMELYLQMDGFSHMESHSNMYSIWPIHRILHEYLKSGSRNFIGFACLPGNNYTIGFLKNNTGIFGSADQRRIAETFKESLLLISRDPQLLY